MLKLFCSLVRSKQDQVIYEMTKTRISSILNGSAFDKTATLAHVISNVIANRVTVAPKLFGEQASIGISQPIFPLNRATLRGLQGLMLQRDYLSRKIADFESSLSEEYQKNLRDSEEYKLLSSQFKSLFCWPALVALIDPPVNTFNHNRDKNKSGKRRFWLAESSSQMIKIREKQAKLIESALDVKEVSLKDPEKMQRKLDQNSKKTAWYLQSSQRNYYDPKSLYPDSFVYTRIKPRQSIPENDYQMAVKYAEEQASGLLKKEARKRGKRCATNCQAMNVDENQEPEDIVIVEQRNQTPVASCDIETEPLSKRPRRSRK